MNKTFLFQQAIGRLFFLFLLAVFLTGCAAQKRSCPPIATAAEAAAVLKEYSSGLKPLRATGNCTLNYKDEKGQKFAQSFPVRIWFESTKKFCLYGDVAFDARAVCFVINRDEYWAYAKPLGIYVTGKTNAESKDYFSNPAVLVDFLEPLDSACANITLANSKDNDILICKDNQGCISRRIFIDRCGHFVKKIEYFNCSAFHPSSLRDYGGQVDKASVFAKATPDKSENPGLVVESEEYKNVIGEKNLLFPHKLTYRYFEGQKSSDRMQIKIDSVKLWQANPAQMKALFSPPDMNSPAAAGKFQKEIK